MNHILKSIVKKYLPNLVNRYHDWSNWNIYRKYRSRISQFGFPFIGTCEMQDGNFEPQETQVIISELNKCDVFVDVGANMGYYSCIASSLNKRTISVEPLRDNLTILFENLRVNNWRDTEVFPLGLADKPGFAELYGASTGASLLSGWAGSSDLWKRTIPLTTLDIILGHRFHGKQLLIKVDIEGAEYQAIQGAQATLAMNPSPIWLVEICLTENTPNSSNPHYMDIFDQFWSNGYTAFSVEANLRVVTKEDVTRWLTNKKRDFGYVSFLFKK